MLQAKDIIQRVQGIGKLLKNAAWKLSNDVFDLFFKIVHLVHTMVQQYYIALMHPTAEAHTSLCK